ncbi:unnamed protein product [Oppiella nova]|uniref:Uncharacterized protein n=1 Tax=Oppiella nova TaxID=334625 RepID=A0A7R9MF13_9ACAR|nr:unnamed protein product [Oppiella nova]CAG2175182.1 unnamed protein product [Oppiella nova]
MKVFDNVLRINLRAYVKLSQLAIPYLEETNGTIISISSIASTHPTKLALAYDISKAGVDMMTKVMALELGPRIKVNTINPGVTASNFGQNSGVPIEMMKQLELQSARQAPLQTIGRPLDIANAVAFLASKDAQFITGANLVVDGGAKNSRDFTGKVVLVTGSSSGIGEGIVKLLSVLGAKVVVTGRKEDQVKRVAQEVQELSPKKLKPLAVVADVTKNDDLNNLMNQTIKTFGKLDVLVNNAGIGMFAGVKDKNLMKVFDNVLRINLRAYVKLSQLAIPYLEETNGTIISISSIASTHPTKLGLPYDISKAGVDMMTKVMALELGPRIRVNTINPGATESNLGANAGIPVQMMKQVADLMAKRAPLQTTGRPLDIANAVAFLASKDAQFITGANLVVDGGLSIDGSTQPNDTVDSDQYRDLPIAPPDPHRQGLGLLEAQPLDGRSELSESRGNQINRLF